MNRILKRESVMLDLLEPRQLLSTVTFTHGKIRIEGTAGNDVVQVVRFSKAQGQVLDNGNVALTFDLKSASGISFNGNAGDDLITIGHVNIKSFLVGGSGNDSLSASDGLASDTILGSDGSDYLFGGAGNDSLEGGALDDTMLGGEGNDFIVPLSSVGNDDFISGGNGRDTVDGTKYPTKVTWQVGIANPNGLNVNDTILGDVEIINGTAFDDTITVSSGRSVRLDGGAGNDTLLTGKGSDTIVGGAGRDSIDAGRGDDTIIAEDSEIDTIIGGNGNDTGGHDANDILDGIEIED